MLSPLAQKIQKRLARDVTGRDAAVNDALVMLAEEMDALRAELNRLDRRVGHGTVND